MTVELTRDEAELLRAMLVAEVEMKRVEQHHARNIDYKAELKQAERVLANLLERIP